MRELLAALAAPGVLGWLFVLGMALLCYVRFRVPIEAPRIDPNDPTPYGRL